MEIAAPIGLRVSTGKRVARSIFPRFSSHEARTWFETHFLRNAARIYAGVPNTKGNAIIKLKHTVFLTDSLLRINQDAVMHQHNEVILSIASHIRHRRFARLGQIAPAIAERALFKNLPAI